MFNPLACIHVWRQGTNERDLYIYRAGTGKRVYIFFPYVSEIRPKLSDNVKYPFTEYIDYLKIILTLLVLVQ